MNGEERETGKHFRGFRFYFWKGLGRVNTRSWAGLSAFRTKVSFAGLSGFRTKQKRRSERRNEKGEYAEYAIRSPILIYIDMIYGIRSLYVFFILRFYITIYISIR
jgi:hypothetical protein